MKKICANCKTDIFGVIYIDFHMTGKNLCQRCSIESEIEINMDSLKQAKKKIEDYELAYKPLLGEESEEYLSLIETVKNAIQFYEKRILELKNKLNYRHMKSD